MSDALITYDWRDARTITVIVERRLSGTIKRVPAGWQYFPKGQKKGGKIYEKLSDCKRSLEGD